MIWVLFSLYIYCISYNSVGSTDFHHFGKVLPHFFNHHFTIGCIVNKIPTYFSILPLLLSDCPTNFSIFQFVFSSCSGTFQYLTVVFISLSNLFHHSALAFISFSFCFLEQFQTGVLHKKHALQGQDLTGYPFWMSLRPLFSSFSIQYIQDDQFMKKNTHICWSGVSR